MISKLLKLKLPPLPIPDVSSDFYCPYCDCRHSVDELVRFGNIISKSVIFQCVDKECKRRFLLELAVCYKTKVFKIEEKE